MIRNVYFDTNVWDHIYKGVHVSESDFQALSRAVKAGEISVLLSLTNLEEVLSALRSRRGLAIGELRLILSLADRQRLLKSHHLLVSDDIKSYAVTGTSSSPFITDPAIQSRVWSLHRSSDKDIEDLLVVAEATEKQKERFSAGMRAARKKVLSDAKKLKRRHSSFKDCWERLAGTVAENLAAHVGVSDACKKRGINGLLELRSLRLAVGMNLSLVYAQTSEGRTPKRGDSRDIHHSILASAADKFVVHDKEFRRLLSRVPIEDFEVTGLNDLIKEIC